jgi:adenine C2-methylase RlmN of 23S rRNA A2503 and tRNA A37
MYTKHVSALDQSVNFVKSAGAGQIECRFVRREDKYFIIYLSSQTGCEKACRMCHLTATGQNKGVVDVDHEGLLEQANVVFTHYKSQAPAELVHFNFMARGEPLASQSIIVDGTRVVRDLMQLGESKGLASKCLISTIMPNELLDIELADIFTDRAYDPDIYYSIYSMREDFRKRWLPRAMGPWLALEKLKRWQETTGKIPKIHFAFIEGENDSIEVIQEICEATHLLQLKVNMNIVRYNPFSAKYGKEASEETIQTLSSYIQANMYGLTEFRIVPRVGSDVHASCGMFVP